MADANRPYEEKIRQLAEPLLAEEGMEIVLVECLRMKSRWLVRLYIDKEGGVTLNDCSAISHQLGDILDVHDIPRGSYTLEVSSPGLDRPLTRDKDFIKYTGSKVRITVGAKMEGIRNFRGKLIDYLEENGEKILLIEVDGRMYRIPKKEVTKARLDYEF